MPRTAEQKEKYNEARRLKRAAEKLEAEEAERVAQRSKELRRQRNKRFNEKKQQQKQQQKQRMSTTPPTQHGTPMSDPPTQPPNNTPMSDRDPDEPPRPIDTTQAARDAGVVSSVFLCFLCFFCTAKFQQKSLTSCLLASFLSRRAHRSILSRRKPSKMSTLTTCPRLPALLSCNT